MEIAMNEMPLRKALGTEDYRQIAKGVVEELLQDPEFASANAQNADCVESLTEVLGLLDSEAPDLEQRIAAIEQARIQSLTRQLGALPPGVLDLSADEALTLDKSKLLPVVSLVFDSFAFVGEICGLVFPKLSEGISKALAKWVSECWDGVRYAIAELGKFLKAWIDAQPAKTIIYAFLGGMFVFFKRTTIKNALKAIFSSMSGWDRFWAIAKFLAMVALLVVSAGGGAILRAIRAVADLINVVGDLQAINSNEALQARLNQT
jgi:hypothetical protein